MSDAVLAATIRAYDEFTQMFQKYQAELKKTDTAQKQTAQGTDQLNQSTSNFFSTIGQLGALYAFQRGLREVMQTGRDFELTIKQAQSVTGDFSRTLRDMAMAGTGGKLDVFTPTQLAEAYRELGAAGASTNEIMAATPNIMEFGTAAIISMDEAAYSVLATAKSFNIALTDAKQITDAYTESMNLGALTGQDFSRIMGSVGSVAKMAGQDFREILSVGSAMRDAGMSADEAGTSIKSALMALINPAKESQDLMKELGVSIYDASGQMKQWSDITAEFERALAPLNDQSRQLALSTVFGSYGIRAMATSMNQGSGYLKEFTAGLKEAGGATHEMATAMADTFDGAVRRTNASLERAKVLLFEDFKQGAAGLLDVIADLAAGFNSLDEGGRQAIEMMMGMAGMTIALSLIASGATKTLAAIRLLWAGMGPVGWAILGISALATAVMGYSQSQQQSAQAQEEANAKLAEYNRLIREGIPKEKIASVEEETKKIGELIAEYDHLIKVREEENDKITLGTGGNLTGTTQAWKDAENGIRSINEELAAYGLTVDTARSKVEALNKRVAEATALDYAAAVGQANAAVETKKATDATSSLIQEYLTLTSTVKDVTDITNLSAAEQSRLSVVVDELANKYPSMVTALDEHGNAMLIDQQGMREQMSVMKALALIETQEARARIEAERSKTLVVIEETRNRMNAIIAEQRALRDANAGFTAEAMGVIESQPALSYLMRGRQNFEAGVATTLSAEMKQRQETYTQAEKALKIYNDALENIGKGVATELPGVGAPGTGTISLGEEEAKKATAAVKELTDQVSDYLYTYRAAVEAVSAQIGILTAKEEYLTQVIESGQGTALQAMELEKVRAEKSAALLKQQEALRLQADAQRAVLADLQVQYEAANDPEVIRDLRDEMDELTKSTFQLQQAWWQAEQQKFALDQAEQKRYDDAYQQAMDLMRHQVTMAQMSTEQQIEYLEKLRSAHKWTQQQMWAIEEDLYRLRRQQLSGYLDKLESEYKTKLDAIDAKTKRTTDAIQRQIDALNREGTASSRLEDERQHDKKITDLEKQKYDHELRTGVEHQKAIADLDEQIAEEKRQWELQQQEWSRDDQKEHLQDKIDAAEEAGQEERRQLEQHYQRARKIAEDGIMDTIASLAATEPKWMQTGKDLIDALIRGLESGNFSGVQSQIAQISQQAGAGVVTTPNVPSPGGSSGGEEDPSSMTWQQRLVYYKTHTAAAMAEIARAGQVYTQKLAAGDIEAAGAAHHWGNQIREAIGQSKTYDGNTASSSYKGYKEGGPILYDQLAELHAGEYVIPARLVDAISRSAMPTAGIGGGGGGVTHVHFYGPIVGEANISSDMDVDHVTSKMRKGILELATARGR